MKTQRLNLLEAINFALAGYEVKSYTGGYTIKHKNGYLALYSTVFPRGRLLNIKNMYEVMNEQWHAGDDRSIEGYFNE